MLVLVVFPAVRWSLLKQYGPDRGAWRVRSTVERILLVDDEPSVLRALSRDLRNEGELMTHDCSLDALRVLQRQPPAIVIADYRMPGLDGLALLEHARAWSASTVRIMISGCADGAVLRQASDSAGIYRFLAKPWDRTELVDAVRQALELYRREMSGSGDEDSPGQAATGYGASVVYGKVVGRKTRQESP